MTLRPTRASRSAWLAALVVLSAVAAAVAPAGVAAGAAGPSMSYSGLTVVGAGDDDALPAGSTVTVRATVENVGDASGTFAAPLRVDGAVVDWRNGTLAAGASTVVAFRNVTLAEAGTRTVAVASLPGEDVTVEDANWKYHGGLANRGHYPDQRGPTSRPVEAWNRSDGTPQVMQPTVVGGTMYTAFHDGGKLYALDPETGAETWSATPGGSSGSTWTAPAYADGVLYLGSNDYKLHAVDASDGSELWNYTTQTNVRSAPAVVDGAVYFGSNDGNLTAVNATTGEELWYYTEYQPVLVESNPAVVDGVVYFGSDARNVTALNASTGEKIWSFETVDEVQSDPTVAENTVYVGGDSTAGETSGSGQVYALNATDGTLRWNHTMAGDVDGGQVYADGTLYAGSRGGDLVALDAADGSLVWNVSGSDFRGAPVVAGGVLYVSDFGNGSVHAFDAGDGTELWAYDSPTASLYPTPLAWNGTLYYGSGSHLYALGPGGPSISNLSVTNPSGRDVAVSFDASERVVSLSVSIAGAESATLTLSDFAETDNGDGTYTYAATYAGSSDGTYVATVDVAADAEGADGADGESDGVVVDATAPTVSNLSASNPSGRDVEVSFRSDERLDVVAVTVGGAESGTLGTGDFTEAGSGPYTYTATYAGSSDGAYVATLDAAVDAAGNDGASGQSARVPVGTAVVSADVEHVSGARPTMADVTLDASFEDGLLRARVRNATADAGDDSTEADYDLAGLGADGTTVLRATLVVQNFTPRALVGNGHDLSWTRTDDGNGTWTISVEGSPAAVASHVASDGSTPTNWPGDLRANESRAAAMRLVVDDLDALSSAHRDRLDGAAVATDAQTFGRLRYDDAGDPHRVVLPVAGPHRDVDGTTNTGSVEATLPGALLDAWNVSASHLAGELDGTPRDTAVAATPDGGARVAFDVHYSAADVAVTVDVTPPTADAGGDRTVDVGAAVGFDAGASADDVGVAGYEWEFGDGGTATGPTPTHTFTSPGNYTVTLSVTDAAGNVDTDVVAVAVRDIAAPTAEAGPPRAVGVDVPVAFDGGASTDDDGVVSYRWTFGDGGWATGETAWHSYAEPGTYTAWLRVEDAAGNVDRDAVTVTVTAPEPTCPVVGERRATSPDGDARCEDVNGDGRFSLSDVTFLFDNREADAVRNHSDTFDFNDDGAFTLSDFTRLFLEQGSV